MIITAGNNQVQRGSRRFSMNTGRHQPSTATVTSPINEPTPTVTHRPPTTDSVVRKVA